MDDLAMAESVVQSSMGVVMVLLHASIESELKHIFKVTRRRELHGVRWVKFLDAYQQVGIDLTSKPGYSVIDSIRNLSNCYKHDAGKPKKPIRLPSGDIAPPKVVLDYSSYTYGQLAASVVEFLEALLTDAAHPSCPIGRPSVEVAIESDGSHKLTRQRRSFLTRLSNRYDIEVKRRICVKGMKDLQVVGSMSGATESLEVPGVPHGVKVTYHLQFVNSRGERSKRVEKNGKRDDILEVLVVQP